MIRERTMEPIATALRKLLDEQGMTDTQLMATADISPPTVSHYLSGKRGIHINSQAAPTVEKIAQALGVPPDFFQEYREWMVRSIMKRRPDLVDEVYDLLVAHDAAADERLSKRRSKGR